MIICCGEALIDMLPTAAPDGTAAFSPTPGGAVFNTAVALGRLGAECAFFSGWSTDFLGTMLREYLEESGVRSDLVVTSDRRTTLAFVRLVDGQASYAFYDENTAGRMLTTADLPDLPINSSALFCGGISLIVEPCGSTYEALATRQASNLPVMVDPNVRPSFVTSKKT